MFWARGPSGDAGWVRPLVKGRGSQEVGQKSSQRPNPADFGFKLHSSLLSKTRTKSGTKRKKRTKYLFNEEKKIKKNHKTQSQKQTSERKMRQQPARLHTSASANMFFTTAKGLFITLSLVIWLPQYTIASVSASTMLPGENRVRKKKERIKNMLRLVAR